jgi:predicted nucleic acid-binding protein
MTLVDASSWIEFLRGRDSLPGQRVKALLVLGTAAWCDMTMVELWNGARGQVEKNTLQELEEGLPLCPVSEQVWTRARKLARACREKGVTAPTADIVIAACAAEHKLELEHNDNHFDKLLPIAARVM